MGLPVCHLHPAEDFAVTDPNHPLPAAGGSYIRNRDGSLTLADADQPVPVSGENPEADEATQPTVKRAVKAPVKEG